MNEVEQFIEKCEKAGYKNEQNIIICNKSDPNIRASITLGELKASQWRYDV